MAARTFKSLVASTPQAGRDGRVAIRTGYFFRVHSRTFQIIESLNFVVSISHRTQKYFRTNSSCRSAGDSFELTSGTGSSSQRAWLHFCFSNSCIFSCDREGAGNPGKRYRSRKMSDYCSGDPPGDLPRRNGPLDPGNTLLAASSRRPTAVSRSVLTPPTVVFRLTSWGGV
jgi:hypothetical protein